MPVSKESREQLGRALAEAREEAGKTVVEIAQALVPGRTGGLSRYYDAEAGRRMATSETVGHYAAILGRPDLLDLRSKILSTRPGTTSTPDPTVSRIVEEKGGERTGVVDGLGDGSQSAPDLRHSLPRPDRLPDSLLDPLKKLLQDREELSDGTVVRGREAVLAAACALFEEAIEISEEDPGSISVQIIQANPERTFTRNLASLPDSYTRLFPYQIQRLISAGGSIRHLLSREIMHTLDPWSAFERFVALMELAGDYSVYWLSKHGAAARGPDYLIIDNVAALEIFPTDPLTWAGDAAVVHRNVDGVLAVIREYGENLIAEADEAFQVTDPSSTLAVEQARVRVDQAILEAEQMPTPRLLIKYGLSTLSEPLKPYERRLLQTHGLSYNDRSAWPAWVKQDLELRRRRLANFLKQIEDHRTVELIPRSALDFYVKHGRYSPDGAEFGDLPIPVPDRIQHLEDVITLIRTNRRYDLIVVDDDPPLTDLAGAGLLMIGNPNDADSPWTVFYQSLKPGPDGELISVAFETSLELFRKPVGGRIAELTDLATSSAAQSSLRLLHNLIDGLAEG